MKSIPDNSIDAIITDPPYGTTACKWDSVIPFDLMWEQLNRIIKPNGAIVLFGSEPFSSALRMSNIKNYKYDWIWKKPKGTGHLNAKRMPMNDVETISVFYRKQCIYNPQFTEGEPYKAKSGKSSFDGYGKDNRKGNDNKGKRYPKRLLEFNVVERNTLHPTQKPVDLMEYLIKTYTNENETVLDFTMGSGSTGVAAGNTNRNFIGIEMDNKYFDIATERINKEEPQKELF
jgi:site-specific DNA-methyltransferase (adenine-specific)